MNAYQQKFTKVVDQVITDDKEKKAPYQTVVKPALGLDQLITSSKKYWCHCARKDGGHRAHCQTEADH